MISREQREVPRTMGSALYVRLDRIGRLLRSLPETDGPLPSDITSLINHAYDDVQEARGKDREYPIGYDKRYLRRFSPGDSVAMILNSSPGELAGSVNNIPVPLVTRARVLEPPNRRSPNDYENMGEKMWFFTSDLPISTMAQVDCTMHLETPIDLREVFHMETEHWSRWREKSGDYWSILTIFPD